MLLLLLIFMGHFYFHDSLVLYEKLLVKGPHSRDI